LGVKIKEMSKKQEVAKPSEFEVVATLGKGGYAIVVSVRDKDGKIYALKKPFHEKKFLKQLTGVINMKELYIMACIKHPYIQNAIKIYFEDPCPIQNTFMSANQGFDRMFFLMSKAEYTCHDLVHVHRAPISHVKRAMFQITCAVQYLHNKGIAHRDLKPGNFLCYYDNGVLLARLTDFGMTKPINTVNKNSTHAGTLYYRAPELIMKNMEYGMSMDIWSLGCAFFEMASKKTLFRADTDIDLLQQIFQKRGSPDLETYSRLNPGNVSISLGNYKAKTIRSLLNLNKNDRMLFDTAIVDNLANYGFLNDFCDLLNKMLVIHPEKRLSINQTLGHPFFSQFFINDPRQFNLWTPKIERGRDGAAMLEKDRSIIQEFPKNHTHWKVGADTFIELAPNPGKYDEEVTYSVRFHGLDIYNRFLLRIYPMNSKKDKVYYKKIAWCSGYIASKYFLDEASDHLWDLFPESLGILETPEIVKFERLILTVLEFEIFKPTCFTYLKHRAFYAGLFILMIKEEVMYDRPIDKIMEAFNEQVEAHIRSTPSQINLQ